MITPVRTTVSCRVSPHAVGEKFLDTRGQQPKLYKGAAVDLRFLLLDPSGAPFDAGNVGSFKLLIKSSPSGSPLVTATAIVEQHAPTTSAWDAGSEQHVTITLTDAQTAALSAGTYMMTLWGSTMDAPASNDVFGIADLLVIDAGISTATPEPVPGTTYATLDDLAAFAQQFIRAGANEKGAKIGLVSPDGSKIVYIGATDDGELSTETSAP